MLFAILYLFISFAQNADHLTYEEKGLQEEAKGHNFDYYVVMFANGDDPCGVCAEDHATKNVYDHEENFHDFVD